MITNPYNKDFYTIADIAIWPWIYALYENYDDAMEVDLLLLLLLLPLLLVL